MSTFQKIVEELGYWTRSYSGRGMYGKECLGVVLADNNLGDLIADYIEELSQRYPVPNNGGEPFRNIRIDSLGKGMIVYFPSIEYHETETPRCIGCGQKCDTVNEDKLEDGEE